MNRGAFGLALLLSFLLAACGAGETLVNQEALTPNASELLSQSLDFNEIANEQGLAYFLKEHEGTTDYPQVSDVEPGSLQLGAAFTITIHGEAGSFGDINGAVFHVVGANLFWSVRGTFDSTAKTMSVTGTLKDDSAAVIGDWSGIVEVALIASDGTNSEVGNYYEWSVTVVE